VGAGGGDPYAALPIARQWRWRQDAVIYPRKETKTHAPAAPLRASSKTRRAAMGSTTDHDRWSKLAAIEPLEAAGLRVQMWWLIIQPLKQGRASGAAARRQEISPACRAQAAEGRLLPVSELTPPHPALAALCSTAQWPPACSHRS